MIDYKTVSQCITADYCRGWNDAVAEIVRCEDCMHCVVREYDNIDELECEFYGVFTDPFGYCSKSERRE